MADCELLARVAAYHDREMPESAMRQFERHLPACPRCAGELQSLREMSGLFAAMDGERMAAPSVARLHEAIDSQDSASGILRIGGLLAGLAASVLVIGSAWLWEMPPAKVPQRVVVILPATGTWEQVAMDLRADPLPGGLWEAPDRQMLADARMADWMLENLSERVP